MKKKISLFLAMLMALTMVMGISVSAMADDSINVTDMRPGTSYTYPITIYNDTDAIVYCNCGNRSPIYLDEHDNGGLSIPPHESLTIGEREDLTWTP